jgi:hypothetical protein
MKSLLKVICLVVLSLFLLFLGSLYVLHSDWFWEKAFSKAVSAHVKNAKVETLTLDVRDVSEKGKASFENVKMEMKFGDETYSVVLGHANVDASEYLFSSHKHIDLDIQGSLTSSTLKVDDLNLQLSLGFDGSEFKDVHGNIRMASFVMQGYRITELKSDIVGNNSTAALNHVTGKFYNGLLTGKISLEYKPSLIYDIRAQLADVNIYLMKEANDEIFSKLRGLMQANITVKGNVKDIKSIKGFMDVPKDAQIKAALLKPLISYIPQSTQRRDLESLIKLDGTVALDKAQLMLESLDQNKLRTKIVLESKPFNVNFNLGADLNVQGGLKELFSSVANRTNIQRQIIESLINTFAVNLPK